MIEVKTAIRQRKLRSVYQAYISRANGQDMLSFGVAKPNFTCGAQLKIASFRITVCSDGLRLRMFLNIKCDFQVTLNSSSFQPKVNTHLGMWPWHSPVNTSTEIHRYFVSKPYIKLVKARQLVSKLVGNTERDIYCSSF